MTLRWFALATPPLVLLLGVGACATSEDVNPSVGNTTGGSNAGSTSTSVATGVTGGMMTGGMTGTTGGTEATGGTSTAGAGTGVGGTTTITGGTTGTGGTGTPAKGEDGAPCTWDSECDSGVCVGSRCGCGNGIKDGTEAGVDCGNGCPPCEGEPCADPAVMGKACGGGLQCEGTTCVPHCLTNWREQADGATCASQTQPDRTMCMIVLDCMLLQSCGPAPCGAMNQCDSNTTVEGGAVGNDLANEVYVALCQ